MFTDEILAELERIEQLTDMFQQGYQAAPLLCQINGIGTTDLLISVRENPSTHEVNKERDRGVIKWCVDQLIKEVVK